MQGIQKISVDVMFTNMTSKKGIKRHGERVISAMSKYCNQIEDMRVMGVLDQYSLINNKQCGHYVQ